jgi:hypothetical protein
VEDVAGNGEVEFPGDPTGNKLGRAAVDTGDLFIIEV